MKWFFFKSQEQNIENGQEAVAVVHAMMTMEMKVYRQVQEIFWRQKTVFSIWLIGGQ